MGVDWSYWYWEDKTKRFATLQDWVLTSLVSDISTLF